MIIMIRFQSIPSVIYYIYFILDSIILFNLILLIHNLLIFDLIVKKYSYSHDHLILDY